MDVLRTCCCCIPLRQGVIILAVMTLLEGIGDIGLVMSMLGIGYCDYGYYNDYYYDDNYNDGYYDGNGNYHHDSYSSNRDLSYECHISLQEVAIWSIVVGSVSCLSAGCLLIGIMKMIPNLLIPFVVLMSINGAAYIMLGTFIIIDFFPHFPLVFGIWFCCWGAIVYYFLAVVLYYRKTMIQQLLLPNRGLVITAYPPALMMPGVATYHTAVPVGMYPPVMTAHPAQPGRAVSTQLQPGTYAQPGAHAQPGAYANPAFYPYAGAYAYPAPGAYPLPGNSSQPGTLQQSGPSSSIDEQPPPYSGPLKNAV